MCIRDRVDTVLKLADEILKPAKAITIDRKVVDEPDTIVKSEVVQHLPVASPLFYLGFKEHAEDALYNAKTQVLYELLLEIVAGEGSPLLSDRKRRGERPDRSGGQHFRCRKPFHPIILFPESSSSCISLPLLLLLQAKPQRFHKSRIPRKRFRQF